MCVPGLRELRPLSRQPLLAVLGHIVQDAAAAFAPGEEDALVQRDGTLVPVRHNIELTLLLGYPPGRPSQCEAAAAARNLCGVEPAAAAHQDEVS